MEKSISHLGEKGFISRLLPGLKRQGSFLVPPGDDAAVMRRPKGTVLSIDGMTEGVHFKSSWSLVCRKYGFSLGRGLGWKAMGSALSDLAAMGDVKDRWAMVFLGAPPKTSLSFLSDLHLGVKETAKKYNCALAGGDTVRSKVLTLVVAVGGILKSKPLKREGIRVGDYVCASGTVGDANLGLNILLGKKNKFSSKTRQFMVERFFKHEPLFREAAILSRQKGVRGLLDLSDPLAESLQILLSKGALDVSLNAIPVSPLYARSKPTSVSLLTGGEDYGLLFGLDPKSVSVLRKKMKFSILGRVKKGSGVRYFLNGKKIKLKKGFEHFG